MARQRIPRMIVGSVLQRKIMSLTVGLVILLFQKREGSKDGQNKGSNDR
jgi:hypothetical protein